ncbi:MAG: hypothetical protein AB7L84_03350 [Acidimicrobiia bacterium]
MSGEERSPVDHVLDAVVYAPIGLVFEGRSIFHQLVERGRAHAQVARVVGRFAVDKGRAEALNLAGRFVARIEDGPEQDDPAWFEMADDLDLDDLGLEGGPWEPDPPSEAARPEGLVGPDDERRTETTATADAEDDATGGPATATSPGGALEADPAPERHGRPGLGVPAGGSLAIPDYDSLAAVQVVNRLAGLEPGELRAVHAYEASHRARRTILNRAAQLLAD